MKTYFIRTFGCQQNEADSEKIAALFEQKGYQPTKDRNKADLVIINSCSIRESAENRVFGLINNLLFERSREPSTSRTSRLSASRRIARRIIVTGCMIGSAVGERKRYKLKELKKNLSDVHLISLQELLKDFKRNPKRKKKKSALIPIMEGCNNFCSYCVVPFARGKEISRSSKEIICEVKSLVKNGCEEIILLGQNVNSYGKDSKESFSKLLRELHKIKRLKKIKFMTSNPWDLTDDIIKALKLPKVERYLHLPVQSGDDGILKSMNRRYTAKKYLALVRKIRKKVPGIKIGTDIIVGFPGETKEQFENTVKLCREVGFKIAYISRYSPRPGTAAFKLKDDVPVKEKKRRWRILDKLINKEKYK